MFVQFQLVITVSAPSARNSERGRRLVMNANFTAVFTCARAQVPFLGSGERVVRTG